MIVVVADVYRGRHVLSFRFRAAVWKGENDGSSGSGVSSIGTGGWIDSQGGLSIYHINCFSVAVSGGRGGSSCVLECVLSAPVRF